MDDCGQPRGEHCKRQCIHGDSYSRSERKGRARRVGRKTKRNLEGHEIIACPRWSRVPALFIRTKRRMPLGGRVAVPRSLRTAPGGPSVSAFCAEWVALLPARSACPDPVGDLVGGLPL